MYTKAELKKQLEDLKVPSNCPVIVHTSLKAVGETEGRGEGLLEVLIEHCTKDGGLLCIPTHTWAFAREEGRIALDLTKKETCIGTLPLLALQHKDGIRSLHPTHSMVVFGERKNALDFISGEEAFDTPASAEGCYGKLYKQNGYILLIGVGHERNTFIHCVDEILNVPNRFAKQTRTVTVKLTDGEILKKEMHTHYAEGIGNSTSAKFPKFAKAFEYNKAVKKGKLGNAEVILCSAVKIKETLEKIYGRTKGIEILNDNFEIKQEHYF